MIHWSGISCCLSATAFYFLGRSSGRDADVLKSVSRVSQLKDLVLLLDTASKVLPLVVTVSGRIGSESPIKCDHSGLRGVMVEETAEQHFLKHSDAGSWIQDSAVMLSSSKEVPWYLVIGDWEAPELVGILWLKRNGGIQPNGDDGTGRAFVVGARDATGLVLPVVCEAFEESGRSIVRGTLDYLQGLKMLGVKRIERILPTGTSLTVVGEAVRDDQGSIRIQKPHKGPFYVSPKNIDELISYLGKWTRLYQYASIGFSIFGVYLLAKGAIEYIRKRRREWEYRNRILAAETQQRQTLDIEGMNGSCVKLSKDITNKDPVLPALCVICLEQEYNAVFVPCGHMCCCMSCSSRLSLCPICRGRLKQIVRTFRH
ncbi:E3 ubiquitin ligase-like protein [Zostera marina]|uniref:RING-type E3 ubiquitin transferase n=1 Tax=Zostera marina TaxID=29655 RepID=A0A0K9P4V2_ZOSMR|nr:E3 ubiquitin ligase-like protein [Zostera marina]